MEEIKYLSLESCGYYNYYGHPVKIWVSDYGELLACKYETRCRQFFSLIDPQLVVLDGLRIDRTELVSLIREAHGTKDDTYCPRCGRVHVANKDHYGCFDAIINGARDPGDSRVNPYVIGPKSGGFRRDYVV